MSARFIGLERVLLALFVASGFAGLIYQAIWSHYLGLSLGHAAYSQTLVLAIFMGGMALGAWLVSRRGAQWRRLIAAYALVEIVIGLAGLAFHPVFVAYTGFSQETVYPALASPFAVRAWQWGSAALLIAPQSILLGMTFPLMSGGYLRVAPKADGEILGGLYFTNSIGAAFGALFATFVLLPWVGMPGAVAFAGVVNLLVGVLAWMVSRRADMQPPPVVPAPLRRVDGEESPASHGVSRGFYTMMLMAAAITGASSFVYEIGWVRMLNQVLGTTVHSFELMLAAFILGLAFGGLWIRRRSHAIGDVVAYAGYAQIWMGVAALVSLPIFAQSFRWVGALIEAVPKTDAGYGLFSLGSAGIALLVMFPAAFFAGMTLPLFTMALLRRGAGEAGIGRIYAANTLGAIVGVALAVHVLIPFLGLHLAVTLAALADIALGLVLLRRFAEGVRPPVYLAALATTLVVLGISLVFGRASPMALASGVFRTGESELAEGITVDYLRDGKTATVAVLSGDTWRAISTNGKPDAALDLEPGGEPSEDEITMLMLGSLPLGLHAEPRRVGVIGWGSGLTTHTLLGSDVPERVDSIEIERAMYEGATLFGGRVARAYTDPRSVPWIDDARTYFSTGRVRYDAIISEPSNPWVSGVASLFTRQFYEFLAGHLNEGGVLVQWIHLYELDDPLLARMLSALTEQFPHVEVYLANTSDLLLVASHQPLPPLQYPAGPGSVLAQELDRVGLGSKADFAVRRLGSRDLLDAMARISGVEPHDDFYPVISLEAPKARFKQQSATWLVQLAEAGLPVLEMTDGRKPVRADQSLRSVPGSPLLDAALQARKARSAMAGAMGEATTGDDSLDAQIRTLRELSVGPVPEDRINEWLDAASGVAEATLADLDPADSAGLWLQPGWVDSSEQAPLLATVLEAMAATARRDGGAMRASGLKALDAMVGTERPEQVVEQMLVIALLGALAEGDDEGAVAIEREYGGSVPINPGSNYGFARVFLLAWADRPDKGAPGP